MALCGFSSHLAFLFPVAENLHRHPTETILCRLNRARKHWQSVKNELNPSETASDIPVLPRVRVYQVLIGG